MPNKLIERFEKHYKALMIITIALLFFSIGVLGYSKITTGEFLQKDIGLKGGLLITIKTDKVIDVDAAKIALEKELSAGTSVTSLKSLTGNQIVGYTFEIETGVSIDKATAAIEKVTGIKLNVGDYTTEDVSSSLGQTFFKSMIYAIIVAFISMSIVVFVYFRIPIPSLAVILAGFSTLIGTMAVMNLLGFKLSTGAIAALLMLIGYSVDTDVLLSTRVLKRKEGSVVERVRSSVKTGLTMQITAIAALSTLLFVTQAAILKQIASILVIGLIFDILNTWIQNVGILRWYCEKKGIQ